MTIQRFAEGYKLRVSRDECGDAVFRGKYGDIYMDAGAVCAMWTDAPPMNQSRLAKLGGTFWQGDISRRGGRREQDALVRGIRPEAYGLAIRLVGAKRRRVMSPARLEALEKARRASQLLLVRLFQQTTGCCGQRQLVLPAFSLCLWVPAHRDWALSARHA